MNNYDTYTKAMDDIFKQYESSKKKFDEYRYPKKNIIMLESDQCPDNMAVCDPLNQTCPDMIGTGQIIMTLNNDMCIPVDKVEIPAKKEEDKELTIKNLLEQVIALKSDQTIANRIREINDQKNAAKSTPSFQR